MLLPDQYRKALAPPHKSNQRRHFLCPHKSGARAACLSQCLKGDGQNADKNISMPGRKAHMLRLCPVAAGKVGFLQAATGSEVEPGCNAASLDLQAEPSRWL